MKKNLTELVFILDRRDVYKRQVQDLTSGGEDCFPKYTKQFLKHYYDTNEIF